MNGVQSLQMSLEMSRSWLLGLFEDIKDKPLTRPTPNGGNHPMWCLGHLVYSEGNLIHKYVKGDANPVADWEPIFGAGTQPTDDANSYPPFDEVIAKFLEVRTGTMDLLATMNDEDLDRPSHAPDEMKDWFGTAGKCFTAVPIHFGFHGGQVADARRADGREALMG